MAGIMLDQYLLLNVFGESSQPYRSVQWFQVAAYDAFPSTAARSSIALTAYTGSGILLMDQNLNFSLKTLTKPHHELVTSRSSYSPDKLTIYFSLFIILIWFPRWNRVPSFSVFHFFRFLKDWFKNYLFFSIFSFYVLEHFLHFFHIFCQFLHFF